MISYILNSYVTKFLLAGFSSMIIDLVLFTELLRVPGLNYLWASTIAYVIATVWNFTLQRYWVFCDNTSNINTQGLRFIIVSLISLGLNAFLMHVFVNLFQSNLFMIQFLVLCLLAFINFITYRVFVFKKSTIKLSMSNVAVCFIAFVWLIAHIPGIIYGTKNLPLHQSYVGDEQSPVNGALHILKDKSLLAVRNTTVLYYGPVFALIAVPPVVADFGTKYILGNVSGAESYKNLLFFDWGGIVIYARIITVFVSLLSLLYIYNIIYFALASSESVKKIKIAFLGVLLVAFNFYFFEYSHFFKHWPFLIFLLLVQIYHLSKIADSDKPEHKDYIIFTIASALSVGISYFSALYLIALVPVLIKWFKNISKYKQHIVWLMRYLGIFLVLIIIILVWHPYPFIRLLMGRAGTLFGNEESSIIYYSKLILLNHLPLVLSGLIISLFFFKKFSSRIVMLLSICITVSVANFMFFSSQLHYEGRYMLPTIITVLIAFAVIITEININKPIKMITIVCIYTYFIFHGMHIIQWIRIYSQGPLESKVIKKVIELQGEKQDVLLIQNYIAGYAHTKNAYQDYIKRYNKQNINLYKEIVTVPTPHNVTPLNLYYRKQKDFKISDIKLYDHVIYIYEPRSEINQFDFFDEDITRLWYHRELSPSFYMLK